MRLSLVLVLRLEGILSTRSFKVEGDCFMSIDGGPDRETLIETALHIIEQRYHSACETLLTIIRLVSSLVLSSPSIL
jgi:hypothetical protein